MHRPQRLISAAILVALASTMGGCASTGGFEPSDLLDWMDTKKKLPGERKPVFPEGVPGVQQGVPREMYRGQNEQLGAPQAGAPIAAPAEVQPQPEPPRQRVKRAAAPRRAAPVRQQSQEPEMEQQQGGAGSGFPAPLPSGSFQR